MRRTPLRRTPFKRKPRRRRVRAVRPGTTPALPPGWKALIRRLHARDQRCRRCGDVGNAGQVDHMIPRRLLEAGELAIESNLAFLCLMCHGFKTSIVEPALYRGDVLAFDLWLDSLRWSGPTPDKGIKAQAYNRLRRMLDGASYPLP